ncbi:MAG: Trm112 family protein [Candidatus Omnitrophica bacterium]|nr:Trm112 family protein [Candidatus Omnitrophota bacterium]
MSLEKEFLEILACPSCKAAVREENNQIICTGAGCGLKYPIRDGIPVMLIEEAEKP